MLVGWCDFFVVVVGVIGLFMWVILLVFCGVGWKCLLVGVLWSVCG